VDKISLPFRILLVVFLVFVVVWFAILRPKAAGDVEPAAAPAPGVTGLATATDKAKSAVDASQASAAANEAAANAVGDASTTTKPSSTNAKGAATATKAAKPPTAAKTAKTAKPATAPKPAAPAKPVANGLAADAAPGDPSRPLLAAVDAGKVAVVLFWNKNASDDRATRRALRAIDLHHGKVVASAVPLEDVGRYEAITRGAQVLESPTVLVIGAGGKARAITGYTETQEIDQAVSDIGGKGFELKKAFRLTGFAKVADDVCKDVGYNISQKADPPTTVGALSKSLGVASQELHRSRSRLGKAKAASSAERALKTALVGYVGHDVKWIADARAKLKTGAEPATVFLALVQLEVDGNKTFASAAKKVHARGCYAGA
jgi:hypothetical protein